MIEEKSKEEQKQEEKPAEEQPVGPEKPKEEAPPEERPEEKKPETETAAPPAGETQTEKPAPKPEPKKELPDIRPGMTVRVHQKIKETGPKGEKERIQVFEGIVLKCHGGKEPGATFTVRKIAEGGIGVEKIFPLHLPEIARVEVVKQAKVRRAKLFFLRKYKKKLKEIKDKVLKK